MGQHIQSAWAFLEQGIQLDSPRPATWKAAKAQLRQGESLAFVTKGDNGWVGRVITNPGEFNEFCSTSHGRLYIIDSDLAKQAA